MHVLIFFLQDDELNHKQIIFLDDDGAAANNDTTFLLVNDTLDALRANCTRFENDEPQGRRQSVYSCSKYLKF